MKRVLVFGGNGFIGAETVQSILSHSHSEECQIILVNRGRSWDWDKAASIQTQQRVEIIEWDRRKQLSLCDKLVEVCREGHFDAVIDFSGFTPFMVEESTKLLEGKTGIYVYISTDSVYDVCEEKTHSGPTKESDAVRPKDKRRQEELASDEDYGHENLQCEEVLYAYRSLVLDSHQLLPYVILRLADVIGPRDSTDRWWQYQTWIELAAKTGNRVEIPKRFRNTHLSFVFVKDVANIIANIIFPTVHFVEDAKFKGEVFNLACKVTPTLQELLAAVHNELGLKGNFLFHESDTALEIYPSVESGPVDITKAVSVLGWDPTPLEDAVKETVLFYKNITRHGDTVFPVEKQDLYKVMKKDLRHLYSKRELRHLKAILSLPE